MAYGDEDRGVGGWLVFFLVTFAIIGPLFLLGTGFLALADPSLPSAYGSLWPALVTAEIALMAVMVAGTWYAAWRFLRVFNWTTVRIGIASLWAYALLGVFGETLLVSWISGLDLSTLFGMSTGPELVQPFVYATIWTLYLLNSKRVRNTYSGLAHEEEMTEVFQ